jgi:hypothetical protein
MFIRAVVVWSLTFAVKDKYNLGEGGGGGGGFVPIGPNYNSGLQGMALS